MSLKSQRRFKLTDYNHKGFDFDGAEGHDLLITDSLSKRMASAIDRHFSSALFGLGEMTAPVSTTGKRDLSMSINSQR